MAKNATVAELIELAIEAEEAAERLYGEMARKFAPYEEVADFWKRYADVEASHAQWLRHIQGTVNPRRLTAPLDFQVLQDARKLQKTIPQTLRAIDNLEDAYQLAHELESSEMNTIFEVLVTNFAEDDEAGRFLRAQLREHMATLISGFPADFRDPAARRAVKALA
jgi:rubrerythrin